MKLQRKWNGIKKVRDSGKYNFEGCKIRVNYKINTDYMRQMLRDYKDIRV